MNQKPIQLAGEMVSWETRRRAWMFAFAYESLFGLAVPLITDGEAVRVYDVWDAGVSIPTGENDATKAVAWRAEASEFFLTIERTYEDLMQIGKLVGAKAPLSKWAFWLEPTGETGRDSTYRCIYVLRPGVCLAEVLALRDKLARPSRALFMQTVKQFNLKAIRDDVEAP